ncbi:MAG TPA: hypothetical protein VMG12_35665, partial [Polyangiaceae bacterium]|nr:hypothetical protein [Polyangiaceae bacterium]
SVTMTFNVPALREAARCVREQHPNLPLAVGGSAFAWHPGLAAEVGAHLEGNDATELVEKAQQLLGVTS